ncbi:hypothetical protein CHS0354_000621 [Potamilus streckersoni]|uniref:Lipoyl-binding domain-containing protein n=1 Tax=Potamilus streckersoni TaxID=2493646 RepID=A0AAE0T714_9BIVA|nr:hypothetical protein CHS0354_000621 [Potamilus streckersoni]
MATTSDLAKGIMIKFSNELFVVEESIHRTPGNLRAFYQVKMRSVKNSRILEHRFRSGEEIEIIRTERRVFQMLYRDGDDFVLMDNQNYDQINVGMSEFGPSAKFIKEGMNVDVVFASDESIVQAEAPTFVELKVIETSSITKDDRATSGSKSAKLETDASVQVPMFITTGDSVRIDTRTGEYMDRVLDQSGLDELTMRDPSGLFIKLKRQSKMDAPWVTSPQAPPQYTHPPSTRLQSNQTEIHVEKDEAKPVLKLKEIRSPMVGTFYRSPSPDSMPYVKIGDQINKGKTLCIIEAMKLMNEIECDIDGIIKEILVENGKPVEYNQLLFLVE